MRAAKRLLLGDPAQPPEEIAMELRLTYEGRLASGANASAQHKHDIRRALHKQIKKFWETHPVFAEEAGLWGGKFAAGLEQGALAAPNRIEELARYYTRGNYRFVPLVFDEQRLLCHLDILFLRPGAPGAALNGADIDNRMKTLFDALKIPEGINGEPAEGENPMFVLLEDDRLVTRVSVETDQLLEPSGPNAGQQDARLVITVRLSPYIRLWGTMGY